MSTSQRKNKGCITFCSTGRGTSSDRPSPGSHSTKSGWRSKFDAPYEKHERSEIAAAEYFAHLRTVLKLQGSDAQIAECWNSIFVREIPETLEMIRSVRATVPCYALTNSNATHQGAWAYRFPGVVQSFDRVFASHEIGLRKPEKRAFEHIAAAIGVPLPSILFFDDLLENVEGAAASGLSTVLVRGPGDVREALRREGMIPA